MKSRARFMQALDHKERDGVDPGAGGMASISARGYFELKRPLGWPPPVLRILAQLPHVAELLIPCFDADLCKARLASAISTSISIYQAGC